MKKFDRTIRVLTVAPLLAAITLILLYIQQREIFPSAGTFMVMLFTLGILPLCAYPMQKYIPKFKNAGRKGQRTLAMLFAVAGYILCAVGLLLLGGTRATWLICLTYLLSGILLLIINKGLKLLASGHGCGIAGPVALLVIFRSYVAATVGGILAIFVCISSIRSHRHTFGQFMGGIAVSAITATVLAVIML